MGDCRGNLMNAANMNKNKNILDIMLKKLNTTKTASEKQALQTIKLQESVQQFELRSQQTILESQLLSNLAKQSKIQRNNSIGTISSPACSVSCGLTFEKKLQDF